MTENQMFVHCILLPHFNAHYAVVNCGNFCLERPPLVDYVILLKKIHPTLIQ